MPLLSATTLRNRQDRQHPTERTKAAAAKKPSIERRRPLRLLLLLLGSMAVTWALLVAITTSSNKASEPPSPQQQEQFTPSHANKKPQNDRNDLEEEKRLLLSSLSRVRTVHQTAMAGTTTMGTKQQQQLTSKQRFLQSSVRAAAIQAAAARAKMNRTSIKQHPINNSRKLMEWIFFNDEFDMLLYRLKVHAPIVSVTHVIEASRTYSGHSKPRCLEQALLFNNTALVGPDVLRQLRNFYRDGRLVLVPYPDKRAKQFCYEGAERFECEEDERKFRRNSAVYHAKYPERYLNWSFEELKDDADDRLHYMSDVDEILNPGYILLHVNFSSPHPHGYRPSLDMFYYNLQCRWQMPFTIHGRQQSDQGWRSPTTWIASTRKIAKDALIEDYDDHRMERLLPVRAAGWHFSYFFRNLSQVRVKNKSYSHAHDEWLQDHAQDSDETLWNRIRNCTDLFERHRDNPLERIATTADLAMPPHLSDLPQLAPPPQQ